MFLPLNKRVDTFVGWTEKNRLSQKRGRRMGFEGKRMVENRKEKQKRQSYREQ